MILGNGQFHGGRLPRTIRSRIGPTSPRRSSMDFLIRKHLWIDISQGNKNHPLVGKERHAVHRYRFLSTLHGSGALKHPCSLTDQLPVLPESSGGVHDGFHLGWNPSISGRNPEHDPVKAFEFIHFCRGLFPDILRFRRSMHLFPYFRGKGIGTSQMFYLDTDGFDPLFNGS